ncbi:hypothetical protein [Niameybacter massiliensis]|uniref:hypothetical protein n=1 Tax=Niameybacter massiliensis TaxID=1658108 RepID=UPI0006B544FE|nr:hypothetical protein [Niameybacter massiliensis]
MENLSMILIYIGATLAIGATIIRAYPRLDITKMSIWNFILPTIGAVCILLGFLIEVFTKYS